MCTVIACFFDHYHSRTRRPTVVDTGLFACAAKEQPEATHILVFHAQRNQRTAMRYAPTPTTVRAHVANQANGTPFDS